VNLFTVGPSPISQDVDENVDVEGCGARSSDPGPSSSTAESTSSGTSENSECRLKELSRHDAPEAFKSSGGILWQSGWRRKLCRCKECLVSGSDLYLELFCCLINNQSSQCRVHHFEIPIEVSCSVVVFVLLRSGVCLLLIDCLISTVALFDCTI